MKRYIIDGSDWDTIQADGEGEWVKYTDLEDLLASHEELRKAVEAAIAYEDGDPLTPYPQLRRMEMMNGMRLALAAAAKVGKGVGDGRS